VHRFIPTSLSPTVLRAALWAILVAGCRTTEPDLTPDGCFGPIQVAILSEVPPRFDWAPECGISFLNVAAVGATPADGETVWAFHVPENAPLGPAVTYGIAPARAHVSVEPKPLVVGTRYRIWIAYTVGGDGITGSGERTFMWFPPD
jgi:hypothetical protein